MKDYLDILKYNIFSIEEKPVEKLEDILSLLSEDQLLEIANNMLFFSSLSAYEKVFQNSDKDNLCKTLKDAIIKKSKFSFSFLPLETYLSLLYARYTFDDFHKNSEEAQVVRDFCMMFISDSFGLNNENEAEIVIIKNLVRLESLGFVFGFYYDDKLSVIVPDEIYNESLCYQENFFKTLEKIQNDEKEESLEEIKKDFHNAGKFNMLANYTKLLINLYGACTPVDILTVYNRDFPEEKIQKEDLDEYGKMICSIYKNIFYVDGEFLTLHLFIDEGEKKRIKNARQKFFPYMPSEEELLEKDDSDKNYDIELNEVENFCDFVINHLEDDLQTDWVLEDCLDALSAEKSFEFMYDMLINSFGFKIESKSGEEKFSTLYTNAINVMHLWTRWGNTK